MNIKKTMTGETAKMPKFVKVSEIEYKIIMLKNRGSALSDKESKRLESLEEQIMMHEQLGVSLNKTARVPSEWIINSPASIVGAESSCDGHDINTTTSVEMPSEEKVKKAFSNAYLQFKSSKKTILKSINPAAKLDLKQVVKEWRSMTDDEKNPYKMKADEEKMMLGNNLRRKKSQATEEERKQSKLDSDRKYRSQAKINKTKKLEEDTYCLEKFSEIIGRKEIQLNNAVKVTENLNKQIEKSKAENNLAIEMVGEKEAELDKLKEKYRILYRFHKSCGLLKK